MYIGAPPSQYMYMYIGAPPSLYIYIYVKELRPLRQQNQDLQMDYDEKKTVYDSTSLQLQTNMSKLETEVRGMREEIQAAETR